MSRKKKKKRVRVTARAPERHLLGSDEAARLRLAARVSSVLGAVLLLGALASSYALPSWNRALGPHGNVALRLAGVALVIVSMMFYRLAK
jgi:hypothetical protein